MNDVTDMKELTVCCVYYMKFNVILFLNRQLTSNLSHLYQKYSALK